MRKKIVAGNWKMNLTLEEGQELTNSILGDMPELNDNAQVIICPPLTHLQKVATLTDSNSFVHTGAQNCYNEASGAYTGEVSAAMVKSTGSGYVILGHSERRQYFNEDNNTLSSKVDIALKNELDVIYCCGEPLGIRDADTQNSFVEKQIKEGLFHLSESDFKRVVIAYEPIWAIGTGRTASAEQAQNMHAHIRSVVAEKYGQEIADNTTILYGGSCKPDNAAELFACNDVDGGLIGGASLKAADFHAIIKEMVNS